MFVDNDIDDSVVIKFKKNDPNAIIPTFAHHGDACFDLYCLEPIMIHPHKTCAIDTGLSVEIPPGWEMQLRPRSGFALKKNISMPNAPGTIDSGYRGPLKVILRNNGVDIFAISAKSRIAQAGIRRVPKVHLIEVDELSKSERGEGGFGSSGVK